MPKLAFIANTCILLSATVAAQQKTQPALSPETLNSDQVAIYRTVLKDYTKASRDPLRLASTTEPFGDDMADGCIKGFTSESQPNIVHRVDSSLTVGMNLVIVDTARQTEEVKASDPQNLIKGAIDHGDKISDHQLDDAVKKAVESGLFTLSEIVFDKEHLNAMVAYSFVCGELCGHGNTVALRKSGNRWKITHSCSSWISQLTSAGPPDA